MNSNLKKHLDPTGKRIVQLLQLNARMSLSEIGRQVGLSTPAVIERVKKLEEAGLITGYRAEIDLQKAGYALMAFIRLHTLPERYPRVLKLVQGMPEVLECHHVTGEESFVIKVAVPTIARLDALIQQFSPLGATSTSIVLSTTHQQPPNPCPEEEV